MRLQTFQCTNGPSTQHNSGYPEQLPVEHKYLVRAEIEPAPANRVMHYFILKQKYNYLYIQY